MSVRPNIYQSGAMFFVVLAAFPKTKPSFVILDNGQKTNNPYPKNYARKKI